MFFDEPRQDDRYIELLCGIAQKQYQLLGCRFDWQTRQIIQQPPKRSFFGRKNCADTVYQQLLSELEELKRNTQEHRRKMGYGSGTFWWNLPWSQIEDYLIYDLLQENEAGSWKFERKLLTETVSDRVILLLHEEGHCSRFSSESSLETGILSQYSQSEIDSKMRDYNHMLNMFDLADLALSDDRRVRSVLSGAEYDSTADYLLSAEHYMVRSYLKEQHAKSLYTETETNAVYVSSYSTHYEAVYAVAEYQVDSSGTLKWLEIGNYRLCQSRGQMPDSIQELYRSKDAAICCAAFLADCRSIKAVPLALFGRDIKEGAASFEDALRQAEIFTCLAGKIKKE